MHSFETEIDAQACNVSNAVQRSLSIEHCMPLTGFWSLVKYIKQVVKNLSYNLAGRNRLVELSSFALLSFIKQGSSENDGKSDVYDCL